MKSMPTNVFLAVAIILALFLLVKYLKEDSSTIPNQIKNAYEKQTFESWKAYTSEENHFKALFPTVPQITSQTATIPNRDVTGHYDMYVSEMPDGTIAMVRIIAFPSDYNFSDSSKIVRSAMDEMMDSDAENTLRNIEVINFQKQSAIQFAIQNQKVRMDGLSFLIGNKLYLLSTVAKLDHYQNGFFPHFKDSFVLTQGSSTSSPPKDHPAK